MTGVVKKITEETRLKMSLAKKGKPGRKLSEEQKKKLIAANTGRKITEETRLKMSLAKKGIRPAGYEKIKDLPIWNKGLTAATDERVRKSTQQTGITLKKLYKEGKIKNWNTGIKIDKSKYPNIGHNTKHSEETIVKMKAARKGKSAYWNKGEKSPQWKGGITKQSEALRRGYQFRAWRDSVFARDNWTCQKYNIRGGKLHPHHILNFSEHPELRFEISNGITLSEKAHREFHFKYGTRNNTFEQLKEFLAL